MTKEIDNSKQDEIKKNKDEFLKDLKTEELEILDETAGGLMKSVDDNNWCDQGC